MRKLVVVALLVTLSLAACGDDDSTTEATDTTTGDAAATEAPVTLSGKVNDEGTEDATGASSLDVAVADFSFAPTFVKVAAGQKLTIALKNEGKAPHTFTSTELGVDKELQPGASDAVEITVPSADAVTFFCKFHQGGGMQGALFTEKGSSPSGGSTATTAASSAGY